MDKNKEDKNKKITYKFNNKRFVNTLLLIAFTVVLIFISFIRFEGNKLNISIGDYSPTDIRATRDIVDEIGTQKLKEDVSNNIQPRYRITPSIQISMKDNISNLFDMVRDYKIQTNISNFTKAEEIGKNLGFEMSNDHLITLLRMDYQDLSSFESTLVDLSNQIMGSGIREDELEYEKENLTITFETLNLTDSQKNIGIALMTEILRPNEFVDEAATNRARENAVTNVEDILVQENQIIASEGEIINEQKYELIRESGLIKDSNESSIIPRLGIVLLITISVLTLVAYIYFFNNHMINNNRMIALIIIMLLTILISIGLYSVSPYIMPVPVGGLLVSLLINSRLGIITNVFLSLFLGFFFGLDLSLIAMLIIGGTIAILGITNQRQRSNILVSGIVLAFVNMLIITSFGLIKELSWTDILVRDLQVFLNGIITIIITIGSLPLWENIFSILTPIRLLELSNSNQPLLKKLLVEAPGTYHHSLMVGNLSEAAADKIGGNALLARVGSYYHDIGKLYKPYYFKENQFGMSNPHDLLEPEESAKIILAHVTEGIKMAKEYKLPKEIINFIDEHHGSTTVAYFFYQAKEKDPACDIEDFRYKGRKPQSKETALVMLADSVEAAVRSIKEPTKERIEEMINKVVKGKINDGQLDECDITNKDINIIINTFIDVLVSVYHDRIEYPDIKSKSEEG